MATLHTFSQALITPNESLATLRGVEVVCTREGLPALHRTTGYAECEIRLLGERYLLLMPLSLSVRSRMERRVQQLLQLGSDLIAPIRLLTSELQWIDGQGIKRQCDLLLQALPGHPYEVGCELLGSERMIEAIDRLETDLREAGLGHNNLKHENLRVEGDRLVMVRPFDLTTQGATEADQKALEMLRREAMERNCAEDASMDYVTPPLCSKYLFRGNEFEGLYCVEDEAGNYGYVDALEREVIALQFLWADDFHENRAVVETLDGMGVIDRTGSYLIEPRYEQIEYLYEESLFRAYGEGRWLTFDYLGRELYPTDTLLETINY